MKRPFQWSSSLSLLLVIYHKSLSITSPTFRNLTSSLSLSTMLVQFVNHNSLTLFRTQPRSKLLPSQPSLVIKTLLPMVKDFENIC
jgi:hypothetical protein